MSLDFLFDTPPFKELAEAARNRKERLCINGVTEAAKPYVLACLAREIPRRIVCIRPPSHSLARLEEECRFFLPRLAPSRVVNVLPALAGDPYLEIAPSLDVVSSRMEFLYGLLRNSSSLILTDPFGLLKSLPCPRDLESLFLNIEAGQPLDRDRLLRMLSEFGYSREDIIASPGEYAWRGGIVDVFSPWQSHPFRIEVGGEAVVSLREFDVSTQKSVRRLETIRIPSLREYPGSPDFFKHWISLSRKPGREFRKDYEAKSRSLEQGEIFPSFVFLSLSAGDRFVPVTRYLGDALFIADGREEIEKEWNGTRADLKEQYEELRRNGSLALSPDRIYSPALWRSVIKGALVFQEFDSAGSRDVVSFAFQPVPRFNNKIPFFLEYMKKLQRERDRCFIYLANQGTRQRLAALLEANGILAATSNDASASPRSGEIILLLGNLGRGFSYPKEKIVFFSEKDIFTEEKILVSRPPAKAFFSQFQDLKSGDHVVHTDYGIGVFHGLRKLDVEGQSREFIEILYRDDDKLLVPVENLNLVQKFSKVGTDLPPLDKLGTNAWQKTKTKTKKAVQAIAKELLDLYARRRSIKGFSFGSGGEWESGFEDIFEYEETEDQLRSIGEIRQDMEADAPMDRLLCGDVGYGKTEVAMRAAFKAVMNGKQAVVLCPTTVLASQHLKTFRNRMVLFPLRIEALTRLQSRLEQKRVLDDLKKGSVDIIIGTHRLLSKDVMFRDLGLLVVDEEQRFGVGHKEKIKQLRARIDVLTLTATPIPRTLNLSLTGLRDISLIETPPRDRLSVHTVVTPFNAKLIAAAVRQELNRGGQVYYVHNRIEDIGKVVRMIEKLVPQSKVISIHGQMSGRALEKRMMDFIDRKFDVLVSTTIIENGIDIPLVNTLIVERADRYGLAQLYQLRGRVGRSARQAFAYFLSPPLAELTPQAKERLKALKEFSELGSGFRLAAKDLEIRGAGNMLGHRQSGSLEAVGYEYFVELLDQAIRQLKGETIDEINTEINLKVDIRIPEDYLPQVNLRLNLYKRISSVDRLETIEAVRSEINDRFGEIPAGVENLLRYGAVKFLAQRLKISALDRTEDRLIIKFHSGTTVDPTRLPSILKRHGGTFAPSGIMALAVRGRGDGDFLNETLLILKELSK